MSAAISIPSANRSTRVPQEVLTDLVVEEIKTRCCFVGDVLGTANAPETFSEEDNGSEFDVPPSDTSQSESAFSHTGRESNVSSQPESSEFSIVSSIHSALPEHPKNEGHLQALATMYTRHSTATDLRMPVMPPPSQQTGTGRGTLVIPGWIRERAAEMLFEGGDVDESSLAEVILDSLLKASPSRSAYRLLKQT